MVYLMKVQGLASYFLDERRRFRKFSPSTPLSIYRCVMLLIFLFSRLAVMFENIFNDITDNVYAFAAIMKSSPYEISHSCFLFCTLLFRGEVVNLL